METHEQNRENLIRLAAAHGIQSSYWDIWGRLHEVPLETLREMLTALGVASSEPQETLRQLEDRARTRLAEPVLVECIERLPRDLVFNVPTPGAAAADEFRRALEVRLEIVAENGTRFSRSYGPDELTLQGAEEVDGTRYSRWSIPFPEGLSLGTHQFYLSVGLEEKRYDQSIAVILCPDQAYLPPELRGSGRRAGIAIALYALRSQHNWGIGDFGDLKEFVRWAIESLDVDVIGLNPLHAIPNRQPYNISPYYPTSRLYRNFIYLDVESMEDYRSCQEAKVLVAARETQELLGELRASPQVQYERVAALKLQVLERVFHHFRQHHWHGGRAKTERAGAFEAYCAREGSMLERFATFCALSDYLREQQPDAWHWRQWPESFQDPHSRQVDEFCRTYRDRLLFHEYLQWQVELRLQDVQATAHSMGACLGLYHDLALGIDPGGADSWAYQDFWVFGVTVGAPPDDFALKGQEWGFHPPRRDECRRDGYGLFLQELRKNCEAGGALRIDHIMRFFRLFWILKGQPPAAGTYVEDFHHDLVRILALESQRRGTLIIGEDLGTVPPQVRDTLQGFGIFSYRVFYFEKDEHGSFKDLDSYPEFALATVSTHDLPTLAGFWTGEDIRLRNRLGMFPNQDEVKTALERRNEDRERIVQRLVASGFLSEETAGASQTNGELTDEVHSGIVGFLMSTPAKLVILSQEDLFKETRQQNMPGTVSQYPNWSTKMGYSLEDLWQNEDVRDQARMFRDWVARSGRGLSLRR